MRKIACVFSFRESSWISCQKIVYNIHKAYEALPDVELHNFHYGIEALSGDLHDIVEAILKLNPDEIVIMDHKPHPVHFMKFLLPYYEGRKKPRIIFHVFGDFTLYYLEWARLGQLMKDFPVEFLVASDRQKILIDRFVEPHHEARVFPFPVRREEFYFDPEERVRQRREWGVGEDEIVFTFTGRISRQKRIYQLLKLFHEALQTDASRSAHLIIYGLPDHVGDHFMNIWENENEYFRRVHRLYTSLPESTRSRIRFMGNVSNSELRPVYAGADFLVNISVHNDEDYGMSVAEAQMCGLPSILTDWGGLASFEHADLPQATRFIPVQIGRASKVIAKAEVVKALLEVIRGQRRVNRDELVEKSRSRFSVEAAVPKLRAVLEGETRKFVTLSELHNYVAKRISFSLPIYMNRKGIHPVYRKIYSAYVRNP